MQWDETGLATIIVFLRSGTYEAASLVFTCVTVTDVLPPQHINVPFEVKVSVILVSVALIA